MKRAFKECMKPHALAHSVTGAAVALIVLALVPSLGQYALVLGVVLLVAGIAWDLMVNKPRKS